MIQTFRISLYLLAITTAVTACNGPVETPTPPADSPPAAQPAPTPAPAEQPAPAGVAAAADGHKPADELPEIVARVGDHAISRDDYRVALFEFQEQLFIRKTGQPPVPHMSALPPLTEEQKALVLNSMIEARIFADLAAESGIVVTDEEVNTKLQELKDRLANAEEYNTLLAKNALSDDGFREKIRLRLLMEKYGDSLIEGTTFNDSQIQLAYDRLKENGGVDVPQTADIAHIFLPVDQDNPSVSDSVQKEIEAIRQRILGGEDFHEVAKAVSKDPASAPKGGVFEDVRKGQLGQSFDDRLFTIPLNEVTEPFRSIKGWHIMKVMERHPARDLTVEEAKPAIEKMLLAAKRREAMARNVAEARPTRDIEMFVDFDLAKSQSQEKIISLPADAVKNPGALPQGYAPPDVPPALAAPEADTPAEAAPAPAAPNAEAAHQPEPKE